MLGVSPEAVQIDINNYMPAVSILQLVLAALPVVAAAVAYRFLLARATWHYQASLFCNLVATTHDGYDGERPEFMKDPPEVSIVKSEDKAYLGTAAGVFCHTENAVGVVPRGVWRSPGPAPQYPSNKSVMEAV